MDSLIENICSGRGQGIVEWLADACSDCRERIAIEWGNNELSYGVLDEMANRVANCLIAKEVSAGSIAVVLLDDRVLTIPVLLGIFRAGAVFVPLDGSYPEQRLRRIVAELSPDVFIIGEAYRDKVKAITGGYESTWKVITLGEWSRSTEFGDSVNPIAQSLKEYSAESPAIRVDPDAIRYIYYTSGSTGQPKGIAGRLAGLSHFIQWEIETFNVDVSWRISQFISPTFDAYFRDVLVALCAGGTVCIPPDSPGNLKADVLIDWIDSKRINLIHCVPSLLQGVLAGPLDSEKFKALKHVLLSGEELHVSDVKRWMEVFGDRIALVNLYGSTETTMVKFFHIVHQCDLPRGFIPIGKPMKGARALVLDDRQRVCPPGVAGEIYIRTPFRTLGYYKNPDATKKVFIQNPFNDDPDDLIYRTGDLGLILNDGNFRFLGRKDNQVKIRGLRVELGEIENHLLNHPFVSAAVVIAREDDDGEMRLAAYIVAKQEVAPSVTDLRDWLKQELPDYMVPSAFVFLDSLPLTSNGKVNRQALPAPSGNRLRLEKTFVAPRTPVERALAGIWARLLNVEQVGIHDNFFDLGGHSMLAARLFAEIEKEFHKRLPLSSLFQKATIGNLVALLNGSTPSNGWSSVVAVQSRGARPPFFCIHELFGDVLCYMNLARHLGQDQPFYAVQSPGLKNGEEPFDDIETMAAHYVKEVQAVQPKGPYALGGLSLGGVVAFEMARQLRTKGEAVGLVALFDSGVNAKSGTALLWSFLRNLSRDFPSWLTGAWQLTGAQWLALIRLKIGRAKAGLTIKFRPTPERFETYSAKLINEMGDVFQFSEQHRKVARAQYQALRNYRPRIYPGRLTLFRARMQPFFSLHDPEKGWGKLAAGGLDINVVPGNHLGMLQEPHVQVLAQKLSSCLDRAFAESRDATIG